MKNHSKVLSAILAGSLALGAVGAAVAGSNSADATFSTVRSVEHGMLTLADGSQYNLPYGFDLSTLQVGEHVSVIWTHVDNSAIRDASVISAN